MIIKINEEYLKLLNDSVAREMGVSVQYMLQHTKMEKILRKVIPENILEENTNFDTIGAFLKKMAIEEMKHLAHIIERIYILGGVPTTKPSKITVGDNIKDFCKLGYEAEIEAMELYRKVSKMANDLGDIETWKMFNDIYSDEEEHMLKFQEYMDLELPKEPKDPKPSNWTKIFTDDYIALLNKAVFAETSAIVQYTNQHEKASAEKIRQKRTVLEVVKGTTKADIISGMLKKVFLQEMEHLEMIMERIFEVDGEALANVDPLPVIGKDFDEVILLDRDAEDFAIMLYRDIINKATELGDIKTKKMFEQILQDEEDHYWLFDDYAKG